MIRRGPRASDLLVHAVLLAGAAVILLPFVWMLVTSFKPPEEIRGAMTLLPDRWYAWENYSAALTDIPLLRFMANGALVCALILVIQVLVAAPCGYALAKLDFRGRPLLFSVVLLDLLIPIQIPALPLYIVIARLQMLDSYTALVLPFAISVFAIFLFRQFFKAFPDEIIDAARLDGFSELSIVWRIMLPAAWPAVAAFSIFSVVAHWNDLYWPLIVVTSPEMMTPPYGIAFFRESGDGGGNDVGPLMAAGVLVTAPMVIGFLIAQQQFIRGLTLAGQR